MDRHTEVTRHTSRAELHFLAVRGGDEKRKAEAKAELERRNHQRQVILGGMGLAAQFASAIAALALVYVVSQQG